MCAPDVKTPISIGGWAETGGILDTGGRAPRSTLDDYVNVMGGDLCGS